MFHIPMINYTHNKQTAPRFSKCRHITTTTSNLRNVKGDLEITVTYEFRSAQYIRAEHSVCDIQVK
jgi:hypothetical protein